MLGIAAVVVALAAAVAVVLVSLDGGGPRVQPLSEEAAGSGREDQGTREGRRSPGLSMSDPAPQAPEAGGKAPRRKATRPPRRAHGRQASGGARLAPVRAQSRPRRSRKGARKRTGKRVKAPAAVPAAPSTAPVVAPPAEQSAPTLPDDSYPISLDRQPVDAPPDAQEIEIAHGELVGGPHRGVYKRGQRVRLRVRSDEDDRGKLIEFDAPAEGLYELRRQGHGFVFALLGDHR